jgi:hypothetical protein
MAKGDVFDVAQGDEIEVSFQLNFKRAEIAKRRDADKLTHVVIFFTQEPVRDIVTQGGTIEMEPLSPDAQSDPRQGQILPITSDDPKFTRLFRVGRIEMLNGFPPPPVFEVRVTAKITPSDGEARGVSVVPSDPVLCKLRVKTVQRPGAT